MNTHLRYARQVGFAVGLTILAGLALQPAHADKQGQDLPHYQEGHTFIYTNRRVEQFLSADGQRLTWASRSGRAYVRDADFTLPNLHWESDDTMLRRQIDGNTRGLWPLAPGRSNRYSVTTETRKKKNRHASRSVRHWSCRVRTAETIKVRAGEFSVYPIICSRYSSHTMRLLRKVRWDYAPTVGHYVRKVVTDIRDGRTKSFELAAVLPPEEANRKRIRSILKTLKRKSAQAREVQVTPPPLATQAQEPVQEIAAPTPQTEE